MLRHNFISFKFILIFVFLVFKLYINILAFLIEVAGGHTRKTIVDVKLHGDKWNDIVCNIKKLMAE